MSRLTVAVQVLGVGEGDAVAEEVEGLLQNLRHAGELALVEDVGSVHHHLQVFGADLVE